MTLTFNALKVTCPFNSLKDKFNQKLKRSRYLFTPTPTESFVAHKTFQELHSILLNTWGTKQKKMAPYSSSSKVSRSPEIPNVVQLVHKASCMQPFLKNKNRSFPSASVTRQTAAKMFQPQSSRNPSRTPKTSALSGWRLNVLKFCVSSSF